MHGSFAVSLLRLSLAVRCLQRKLGESHPLKPKKARPFKMQGCKLEAFILNHQAAERLPDKLRHLHRCRLSDRLTLVPVTDQLCKEVVATFGKYEAEDDPYEDSLFSRLHPALSQMAIKVSLVAPVLYLERDIWSGIGDTSAIVWHQGEAVFGPEWGRSHTTKAFRLYKELEGLPLDQALDTHRYRFTEEWVQEIESDSD